MFIDPARAARIDRAEAGISVAIAEAARSFDPTESVLVTAIGGGTAILARPGSPVNKVIGVGFEGPLELELLAPLEDQWHARGEAVRVELSSLASIEATQQLAARGYRLTGFEHVLVRPLHASDADTAIAADIVVGEDDSEGWLRTVVEGFAAPDGTGAVADDLGREALEGVMRDFAAAQGFRRYSARIADKTVGAAAMRLDDGVAFLCGASTVPTARRRGVQAALLATRLAEARRAGCELAVVTTAPGSMSQRNVGRHGFTLAYVRAILLRDADTQQSRQHA